MLYKPNFCCHCAEKIVRARWTPLTSRRFCDFCAVEQKQHDLIPRAAAVLLVLFGAAGLTAYFSTGARVSKSGRSMTADATSRPPTELQQTANVLASNKSRPPIAKDDHSADSTAHAGQADSKQRAVGGNSSTQAVYYCGAMTKKGTACTRRVKVPGRCWQHSGQAAQSSSRD